MRDAIRSTRFTQDEAALIESAAERADLTVAEFLRQAALRKARLHQPERGFMCASPITTVATGATVIWQEAS